MFVCRFDDRSCGHRTRIRAGGGAQVEGDLSRESASAVSHCQMHDRAVADRQPQNLGTANVSHFH